MKAVLMARLMFESQLCILIAYNNPYTSRERRVGFKFVTGFSTRGGKRINHISIGNKSWEEEKFTVVVNQLEEKQCP